MVIIRKSQVLKFSLLCLVAISMFTSFIFSYNRPSKPLKPLNNHVRGVIVTLVRSTKPSVSRAINMMHSVNLFHSATDGYRYPFLIFHDQNFTAVMRQYILKCVLKTNKDLRISFAMVNFLTEVQPDIGSKPTKTIGYRVMCRFWSYDVFYHPAILHGNYDYLMRMDDDSYFSDVVKKDLFSYMRSRELDYMYRAWYDEKTPALDRIEKKILNITENRMNCIYNNFFIIYLKWFYGSKRIQSFLQELLRNDIMLRQYIGDGCVHAAMLDIDNQSNSLELRSIPYGHNYHITPYNHKAFFFNYVKEFETGVLNSCRRLTVIHSNKTAVKQINIW